MSNDKRKYLNPNCKRKIFFNIFWIDFNVEKPNF